MQESGGLTAYKTYNGIQVMLEIRMPISLAYRSEHFGYARKLEIQVITIEKNYHVCYNTVSKYQGISRRWGKKANKH